MNPKSAYLEPQAGIRIVSIHLIVNSSVLLFLGLFISQLSNDASVSVHGKSDAADKLDMGEELHVPAYFCLDRDEG